MYTHQMQGYIFVIAYDACILSVVSLFWKHAEIKGEDKRKTTYQVKPVHVRGDCVLCPAPFRMERVAKIWNMKKEWGHKRQSKSSVVSLLATHNLACWRGKRHKYSCVFISSLSYLSFIYTWCLFLFKKNISRVASILALYVVVFFAASASGRVVFCLFLP